MESVQTFGRKVTIIKEGTETPLIRASLTNSLTKQKTAVAVAHCKKGHGLLKLNGAPVELVQPVILRTKILEPILLLGRERFAKLDIRIRVSGGGYTSQIYAVRQALAKAVVAYNQKCTPSFSHSKNLIHTNICT